MELAETSMDTTRRQLLAATSGALTATTVAGCGTTDDTDDPEPDLYVAGAVSHQRACDEFIEQAPIERTAGDDIDTATQLQERYQAYSITSDDEQRFLRIGDTDTARVFYFASGSATVHEGVTTERDTVGEPCDTFSEYLEVTPEDQQIIIELVEEPPEEDTGPGEEQRLELLAESQINHEHACSHAKWDPRTPLEAGTNTEDAPSVDRTHVIWEVTHQGEQGVVTFDAESHHYDGPFVFYVAGGTVAVLVGDHLETASVADEVCDDLDRYVLIEPAGGEIQLEVTGE